MKDNFNLSDQKEIADFILKNLPRHKHFCLGTADEQNQPWVVCLNLTIDDELNIIWQSKRNTEHSRHIRTNPHVSICIFSQTEDVGDFGFYTKGIAQEVTDEKMLDRCLHFRYEKKGKAMPQASEFVGDSEYKIYMARITEAWVTDNRFVKNVVESF